MSNSRVMHLSRERLVLILSTKPLSDAYEELDAHLSAIYRESSALRAAGQRILPYISDAVPAGDYAEFIQLTAQDTHAATGRGA